MSLCLYKLKNININDIAFKLYQPKDKKKYNIRCFNKKGQNIMTETIPLYCPYGINTKTLIQDTLQLTISLSSRLLHDNTEKFYDDMGDLEQHIVNNEDKFISNNYSCKSMSMISCIDDNDKLNVYTQDITKNTFKVYDNNNNIIGSKDIRSKSFVQCIFWLYGIWLNNDTYGLNWKLVQCKLYPDIFSIDKCLFFSDDYDMKEILYDYPKKIDNMEDYDPELRLKELNIELPNAPNPVANYVNGVQAGNLIFLAGKGPRYADGVEITGKLGDDISIEKGYEGARLTAINQIAVLKEMLGDLKKVKRIVKVLAFVNSTPDFIEQPKVINGFSDLMVEVFGKHGIHARAAIGVATLPRAQAVEVECIVEVYD